MRTPHCPLCTGPSIPLGVLGRLAYWRCAACGAQYSKQMPGPALKSRPLPVAALKEKAA
jgi:transposase-like protein